MVEALRLWPYFSIPIRFAGDMPKSIHGPEGTEEARMLTGFVDGWSREMNYFAEYILQSEPRVDGATVTNVLKETSPVNFEFLVIHKRITRNIR
jgi:hypothetical protein